MIEIQTDLAWFSMEMLGIRPKVVATWENCSERPATA